MQARQKCRLPFFGKPTFLPCMHKFNDFYLIINPCLYIFVCVIVQQAQCIKTIAGLLLNPK